MNVTLETETRAFTNWTARYIRDLEKKGARNALRVLAFDFLNRVIAKTPVDLGRARGGWASYLIANNKGALQIAKKGQKRLRDKKGRFREEEFQEGVKEGSFEEHFLGSDQFILIINAVQYIVLLEFGSSDQSPAGMMRITFRDMRQGRVAQKAVREEFIAAVERTNRARRGSTPKWEKAF